MQARAIPVRGAEADPPQQEMTENLLAPHVGGAKELECIHAAQAGFADAAIVI